MRAAVWYGKDDIRIEDVLIPDFSENEVLLKVLACGLCKTDIKKIHGDTLQTKGVLEPPRVFGHEIVGVIDKIGSNLDIPFKVGDRVVIFHHIPCLDCYYCMKGDYVHCKTYREIDTASSIGLPSGGGFGEYVRIPEIIAKRGMIKIPLPISNIQATQVEPTNCCIKAINKANIQLGDKVAIFGCGPIGLTLIQLAKMRGAMVFGVDLVSYRMVKAKEYGADYVHFGDSESLGKRNIDKSIIAVESPKAIEKAIRITRGGGTIVFFAEYGGEMGISNMVDLIYGKELTIKGSYSSSYQDHELSANLVFTNELNTNELISHTFPLEDLQKAVDLATKRRGSTWEGEEHSEVKESFKIVIKI